MNSIRCARRGLREMLVVTALLAASANAWGALKATAPAGVDLTGYWRINPSLSDDAEKLLQQRIEEDRRERERWLRRQGIEDPLGIPPLDTPPPNDASQEGARPPERRPQRSSNRRLQQMRDMLGVTDTLSITQSGSKVQIQTEYDTRSFEAGTRSQVSLPQGELADSRVGWDGTWFVIDRRSKGPRMLEKYRWNKRTDQLESLLVWSGDSPLAGIKVHRVFDRMKEPPPKPDPERGPVR